MNVEHVTHNGKHVKTYELDGDRRTLIWAAASNSSLEHTARLRNIPYQSNWNDPVGYLVGEFNPRNHETEERRRTRLSEGDAA